MYQNIVSFVRTGLGRQELGEVVIGWSIVEFARHDNSFCPPTHAEKYMSYENLKY